MSEMIIKIERRLEIDLNGAIVATTRFSVVTIPEFSCSFDEPTASSTAHSFGSNFIRYKIQGKNGQNLGKILIRNTEIHQWRKYILYVHAECRSGLHDAAHTTDFVDMTAAV